MAPLFPPWNFFQTGLSTPCQSDDWLSCLCFPQFCSTRAELVICPHHDVAADLDQRAIIGVDLPAFLLSKNFDSDSIGMP